MSKYINTKNTPLSVAVWLAIDEYDHNPDPNVISVTSLLKPIKQLVLTRRMQIEGVPVPEEVSNLVASRMGTAFHNSIESAWRNNYKQALKDLGYPKGLREAIVVNPPANMDLTDRVPIYTETRTNKKIGNFTLSGEFDFCAEGRVRDFKSTGVFTYQNQTNDKKYILQGSMYRWLNPEIITDDIMAIDYIFTDWQKMRAMSDKTYPQNRVMEYKLELLGIPETELYIKNKLNDIVKYEHADEADIPECSKEDLWQSEAVFKYFKNPAKTSRSTKNFDSLAEAQKRLAEDKHVGIIKEVKGEAKACNYCSAMTICKQAAKLRAAGILK